MKYIFGALVLAFVVGGLAAYADQRDASLERVRTCVVALAAAEGYHGDPNSQEAWTTFAPSCDALR